MRTLLRDEKFFYLQIVKYFMQRQSAYMIGTQSFQPHLWVPKFIFIQDVAFIFDMLIDEW